MPAQATVHRIRDAGFVAQVGFHLDGQPFHHSVNYRSVVAFGHCTEVTRRRRR